MHHEDPEPLYGFGDRVTVIPLRAAGQVRRAHFDDDAQPPRWLYYVRFRDGSGDLLGRYFTRHQLQSDEHPQAANFEP